MTVEITTSGSTLRVVSPYNSEFVSAAKRLGGKWRGGAWELDARDEARVRTLCRELYGSDGESVGDLVTLRVEWRERDAEGRGSIAIAGRTIARATGRDSGARLGDGVAILAGGFHSGGSMKNWSTVVLQGTVVLVRDFPRATADQLIAAATASAAEAESAGEPSDPTIVYSVEPEAAPVDPTALRAERERIVARLAEIDRLLGGM